MQNANSKFVANLVALQNVISNVSGLDANAQLSNAVGNLQQMVNFDTKTVYTNYLGAYTADASINVISPINLCNVGITSNNIPLTITSNTTSNITIYVTSLTSTVQGLGAVGYTSSFSLVSTVSGLGSLNFISSLNNIITVSSLVGNFSSITAENIFVNGVPVVTTQSEAENLASTVIGLVESGYINTSYLNSSLVSTLTGLGSLNYLSSLTNTTTVSSMQGTFSSIGVNCNSPSYTIDVDGTINANANIYVNGQPVLTSVGGGIILSNLTSTVQGLGSINYVSSLQLQSTVKGLGSLNYLSSLSNITLFI